MRCARIFSQDPVRDTGIDLNSALSVLEAAGAYCEAWESGDFLVRTRKTFDSVMPTDKPTDLDGTLIENVEYCRVSFDMKKGRYFVARYMTQSALDLSVKSRDEEAEVRSTTLFAGSIDAHGDVFVRRYPDEVSQFKREYFETNKRTSGTRMIGFPDYRWFGLRGGAFQFDGVDRCKELLNSYRVGFKLGDVGHDSDGFLRIRLLKEFEEGEALSLESEWVMDESRMVPLELVESISYRAEKDGVLGAKCRRVFKWREIGGVQVPVSMHESRPYRKLSASGRSIVGSEDVDYEFHWFSLNSGVEDSWFDKENLVDIDRILERVDPSRCGADSLAKGLIGEMKVDEPSRK